MKKTLNIFTFLILSQISIAQIDFGSYSHKTDYFNISNDSVCFDLTNHGCLISHIRGCGIYQISDNYLFIETKDYNGKKSTFKKSLSKNDFTEFSVSNPDYGPLIGVNIICEDSSGNTINGSATNKEGFARIEYQKNIDLIRIIYLACDEVEFKFEPGFDYQVNLVEGNVTEHQTVVYEIISANTTRLKLALLDTDFKTTKDTLKTLRKVKRHNRKHNHSINILEKKQLPTKANSAYRNAPQIWYLGYLLQFF